jgi:hypothetical protein|tara:strand:+ start:234 stop:452 length:219 start_codon:yes stop_codon:yes gene_type:complete
MTCLKLLERYKDDTLLGWDSINIIEWSDDFTTAVAVCFDLEKGVKYEKHLVYLDDDMIWQDLAMHYEVVSYG